MGYLYAHGFCYRCHQPFAFNPYLVPSLTIDGEKRPFCQLCIDAVNPTRIRNGLEPIVPLPGAYEPQEC